MGPILIKLEQYNVSDISWLFSILYMQSNIFKIKISVQVMLNKPGQTICKFGL